MNKDITVLTERYKDIKRETETRKVSDLQIEILKKKTETNTNTFTRTDTKTDTKTITGTKTYIGRKTDTNIDRAWTETTQEQRYIYRNKDEQGQRERHEKIIITEAEKHTEIVTSTLSRQRQHKLREKESFFFLIRNMAEA